MPPSGSVQDRAKAEAVRAKYLKKIGEKEQRVREINERILELDYLEKAAASSQEPLLERANTNMRAGTGTAGVTATATVALIVKFGLLLAPALAVPVFAAIMAANALADRNDTRRMFQNIFEQIANERFARTTELGRTNHELEVLKRDLNRVEELWRKTLR